MSTMKTQENCESRIETSLGETLMDLDLLWSAFKEGTDPPEALGTFEEYHLEFSLERPDEGLPFWCYLLSWGGPSDEFRLHPNGSIEYRFHDWFDGAGRTLTGTGLELLQEIFDYYLEGRGQSLSDPFPEVEE